MVKMAKDAVGFRIIPGLFNTMIGPVANQLSVRHREVAAETQLNHST